MEKREEYSLAERFLRRCGTLLHDNRVPLLTGLLAGLLAHGFAFTNKLLNADEISALFGKGGGVDSGRWLIEATRFLFPNASMPWIYGLMSVFFFSVTACLTIRIFEIRNPFLQGMLAAVFLSFPSLTGLYCYFFTSVPFAFSLLLAVLSVVFGRREGWGAALAGVVLLMLSLAIYQAYIAVVSTYYLLLMIRRLIRGEGEAKSVFLFGLRAIGIMAAALLLYYAGSRIALKLSHMEYVEAALSSFSLPYRVALAYNALLKALTRGYFGFVPRPLSRAVHLLGAAAMLLFFLLWFIKNRDRRRGLLLALCLALLPLSMNCMFLAANVEVIHAIVLHSFVCVYALAVIAVESLEGKAGRIGRDAVLTGMLLIVIVNVYFANETYLKLYLQYENAFATYSEMVAQIKQTEGFDENCRIAIVGAGENALYHPDELDTGDLIGPDRDLVNIYTKEHLVRTYLGFDVPFADRDEAWLLSLDPRVEEMPSYPYYGSVQKIDDTIVVKLG